VGIEENGAFMSRLLGLSTGENGRFGRYEYAESGMFFRISATVERIALSRPIRSYQNWSASKESIAPAAWARSNSPAASPP
jgi:hypothetical protein